MSIQGPLRETLMGLLRTPELVPSAVSRPSAGTLRKHYFCLAMTNKQKQIEIAKKLEAAPDAIIQEVLDFLNDFERKNDEEKKRIIALREILSEKRGLLLRLAE